MISHFSWKGTELYKYIYINCVYTQTQSNRELQRKRLLTRDFRISGDENIYSTKTKLRIDKKCVRAHLYGAET